MSEVIFRGFLLSCIALLGACGGGGSGTPVDDGNTTTALQVKTADGGSMTLSGIYTTACYNTDYNNDGTQDGVKETISIVNDTWVYTTDSYSADTACAGVPAIQVVTATLTAGTDLLATSWVDGEGASDSVPGVIAANAAYTELSGTVTQSSHADISVGINISLGYVIDNLTSTEGVTLHRLRDPVSTGVVSTADPFTDIVKVTTPPPAASGPELEINITSVDNTSYSSSSVAFTVTNTGDTDSGSFNVLVWLDRASAPDYTSAQSGFFQSVINLAAGESANLIEVVDNTSVTPGTALNAYVIADFFEAVAETDEGLTGTNDNLSHMAWTVGDIFYLNTAFYIDNNEVTTVDANHETVINAYYDTASSASFIKMDSVYRPASLPGEMYEAVVMMEFTPGVFTDSGLLNRFTVNLSGQAFSTFTTSGSSITIDSAGAVGELVTGSINANVCPVNSIVAPSAVAASCSVPVTNYTGSFSFIRNADQ